MEKFIDVCFNQPLSKPARMVKGVLVFLILLSIAVIPIHFIPALEWLEPTMENFDKFVVTVFTLEYIARIYIAKNPLKYILSFSGIIDLLAVLPFYLAKLGLIGNPAIFMLLRILRILKMGNLFAQEREETCKVAKKNHGRFRAQEGESIERIVQGHAVMFIFRLLGPLIILTVGITIGAIIGATDAWWGIGIITVCLLMSLVIFYKVWLDFNFDVLYITNKRLMFQRRDLFGFFTNETTYESITNIRPDGTGFIRNIFKYGDIHIDTAAMSATLSYFGCHRPHTIVEHISTNRQRAIGKLRQETGGGSVSGDNSNGQ